jgi:hypothetical protein
MTLALDLAGSHIELRVVGAAPALFSRRYGRFVVAQARRAPRWRFELRSGATPPLDRVTTRLVVGDGLVRMEGLEAHGTLDPSTGRGEALLDPGLVVADALIRAAMAVDVLERGGCLLHAAAVVVDGAAHLVPGHSGAGKSTLAGLAGDVLSDELCAVFPDGERVWAHGTPWWGGRPGPVPVAGVWSLAWGAERLEPLRRAEALRHLASNLVLPLRGGGEEEAAFAVAGRLAANLPFGRLTFRKDTDVDALLRRAEARA